MEFVIREVTVGDAQKVVEFQNIISGESDFLTFGAGEFGIGIEEEEKYIERVLQKKNALFLVAEIAGRVVGSLTFSGGDRQRVAHVGIFGMSVLKEFWGQGIGTELLRALIQWSREKANIRKINLRVRTDNERAIQLYQKMGFVEEGVMTRDLLVDGIFYDSLLMGLCLD